MPNDLYLRAIQGMDIISLNSHLEEWTYQPPEGCLNINGVYTYDMDLFFDVKDMRKLYSWDSGMEYLAICELASGDFPDCHRDTFDNFEDFKICVEAKLTLLSCFNYLSEDQRARRVLYNVCRFNRSKHIEDSGEDNLSII